jgi:hypothetical protein
MTAIPEGLVTQARLRERVVYDPATGVMVRRNGKRFGGMSRDGYFVAKLDNRQYKVHRLAWLYVYGTWPDGQIDHINRNRSDNRIANLRECSFIGNQQNADYGNRNRTGFTGVRFQPSNGRFSASIRINRRNVHIGVFDTAAEAGSAYRAAKARWHPFDAAITEQANG